MRVALLCWVTVVGAPLWGGARFSDPRGFTDAAEMYRTAAVQPFDDTAAGLIKTVGARLQERLHLEDDRVWRPLLQLNSYRQAPQVQEALGQWAVSYAAELRLVPASKAADDAFYKANVAYHSGDFDAASQAYRKFLLQAPGHYDARNNLALAELHLGIDVAAEMELLTLRQLRDSYLPAAVNLTVVYERLGLRQQARELADRAATANKDVPQAVFNAAWYKDLAGSREEALALLTPLAASEKSPPSVQSFKTLIEKEVAQYFFWTVGLAGLNGAYRSPAGIAAALLLFVVASLIVLRIAGRRRPFRRGRRAKPGFWAFIAFVFLYVVWWGLNPVWLLALLAYAIVMLKMARARASR